MNALNSASLRDRLVALAVPVRAAHHQRFFRTGPGGTLPRTTLRYAIERFPEPERKAWLLR